MNSGQEVKILAIESSCDETAAAVVVNGRDVRSNVISSQIDIHTLYGGVVPEIASRKHIERINQVIEQALEEAEITLDDLDAVAVTYGPGLVGALLVGVAEAKAIAYAKKLPLLGVHHIEGHISANYIENKSLEPPFVCLVVSGGHSHFVAIMTMANYFQMFAQFRVFVANGGRNYSAMVLTNYVYKMSFDSFDMGYASAVAAALFVLVFIVAMVQNKMMRSDWTYE